ncbi:hypothetical protein ACFL4X_01370 [Gemmatimonadota bacterium]
MKIAETHTLAISDFAGKDVSLERFCDKVLGPEYDEPTRKHNRLMTIVIGLFMTIMTVAVLAVIYFN